MARTSVEITNDEGRAYQAWCPKRNVIANVEENLNFIIEYFMNWQEMITEQTLELAYTTGVGFRDRLKHYAPGQLEFAKLYAALSSDEQNEFNEQGWGFGLKGDSYKNGIAVLSWLKAHKMKVTKQSLNLACGQQNVIPHLDFDENATRAQNRDKDANRKRTLSEDDHKPFVAGDGMVKTPDGGWRSTTPREQKRAREAAEAAKKPVEQRSSTPDAWSQIVAQLLQFGTARQQKEIKVVHDYCVAQNYSPRRTWDTVNKLVERFKQDAVNSSRSIH